MTLKRAARRVLEEILRRRGYELKQLGQPPRGFDNFLEYYRSRRLPPPATVFDVGVGHGTPWLYGQFPGAKLVLVEPLRQFDASVQSIAKLHDADVVPVALSDRNGATRMRVTTATPTGSSLLERSSELESFRSRHSLPTEDTYVEIPTRRFDDVSSAYRPPLCCQAGCRGGRVPGTCRRSVDATEDGPAAAGDFGHATARRRAVLRRNDPGTGPQRLPTGRYRRPRPRRTIRSSRLCRCSLRAQGAPVLGP